MTLRPNEILSTSFNGFMSLGGEATFGYDTSGTTKYGWVRWDLATKLVLKARAKVNVGYSLAGAFKTTVLPVDTPGSVRVVVEKGSDVHVRFRRRCHRGRQARNHGAADGRRRSGVARIHPRIPPRDRAQILELSALSPRSSPSGRRRYQGLVEKWAGKGFDEFSGPTQGRFFKQVSDGARQVTGLENRAIALYERYIVDKRDPAFTELEGILAKASIEDQRKALLEKISDERLRSLVELFAERRLAQSWFRSSVSSTSSKVRYSACATH